MNAQNVEVSARDQLERDAFGLSTRCQTDHKGKPAEHRGEDFVVILEVPVHRIGNGVAAPVVPVVPATHSQQNQFLGILDREQSKKNLIEQGEDGRVGADAEGQGQDGDGGKAGAPPERAQRVLEVAKQCAKPHGTAHRQLLPSELRTERRELGGKSLVATDYTWGGRREKQWPYDAVRLP